MPAPFTPTRPTTSPGGDDEVEAEREDPGAVSGRQATGDEGGAHGSSPIPLLIIAPAPANAAGRRAPGVVLRGR